MPAANCADTASSTVINEAALLAHESWLGLCRAAHHHAYELAPTVGELRGWHSDVTELVERLGVPVVSEVSNQ